MEAFDGEVMMMEVMNWRLQAEKAVESAQLTKNTAKLLPRNPPKVNYAENGPTHSTLHEV
jgi:hypothetical protein